ncbi:MAG: hypothetical protein IJH34_03685 [Romboutsia sp.]|nr:hypothetical protein [Romboutsia sp.]
MKQFEDRKPGEKYMLIAAGSGPSNVVLPDGTITSAREVKKQLKYPQLLAWLNEQKELLEWVKELRESEELRKNIRLVVDSSAYSAWTRHIKIDIDEYIAFINSISDVVYWFAELDKIPGEFGKEKTKEEIEEAPEYSWKNYLYMIDRVNCPKKILPIFHMYEDYKYLDNMLSYKFNDGSFIEYIGVSPSNDASVTDKMKWYEQTWKFITERCKELNRSIPKTHNFGCTTISIMEQYPSMSSDSTSWVRGASFGNIMLVINGKVKTVYVSDRNMLSPDHINNQPLAVREAVEQECRRVGHGLTLNDLIYNDPKGQYRALFNLYSLSDWSDNFTYEGTDVYKEDLW